MANEDSANFFIEAILLYPIGEVVPVDSKANDLLVFSIVALYTTKNYIKIDQQFESDYNGYLVK